MKKSSDLLSRVLDNMTARQVAEACGVHETAIAKAKARGTLSPEVAGHIAVMLGEDPVLWMAIAGLETARDSKQKATLMRRIAAVFLVGVGVGMTTIPAPLHAADGFSLLGALSIM